MLTETQRKVLQMAASRERGNVCPIVNVRIFAAAETAVIRALVRKGYVDDDKIPIITDAGRKALEGT